MIGLCFITSLKEGTSHLEKINEYSALWKGERSESFVSIVQDWLSDADHFDPWEDHGTLFLRDRRIIFFGWRVEMQGGIFLSIPIVENDENRKRFIVTLWNFLQSSSKYWDELVEELLDFSSTDAIDPNIYRTIDFSSPRTDHSFEAFSEFGEIIWNIIAFNPLVLLNASIVNVGKNSIKIEFKPNHIPIDALHKAIDSPIPSISKIGYHLLDFLSSFVDPEREKQFQNFLPMLNDLAALKDGKPTLNFVAAHSKQLITLGEDLLETLTEESIGSFMIEQSNLNEKDLLNLVDLADTLYRRESKETGLMIMGSVVEVVIERNQYPLLKKIGDKISNWGSQQILSFIEVLSMNFPKPQGEIREILAEIYLKFVDQAETKDEIISLAKAFATIGRIEEAVTLRLRGYEELKDEIQSLEIFEILSWVPTLPISDEKKLAELLVPYLVNALEYAPAGPILIDRIRNLFAELTRTQRKRLILSFTVAITKNVDKVPVLEQVQVLEVIREKLLQFDDFKDLVAIINARILDLLFEEDEDNSNLIEDLINYLKENHSDPDRAIPIIERLLITAGKYGQYSLYLQVLDFAVNFMDLTTHRHEILEAMSHSAIEAAKKEILVNNRNLSIQIYFDIMEMSVLNEDVDMLSEIMDQAIEVALNFRDIESLITFYRMFFTIRQMVDIPWVDKLLHLQQSLVEADIPQIAHELVDLSLELNTDQEDKEKILKSQLALEETYPGYLNPEQIVQIKQELIEIYRSQNRVDDVLTELQSGHKELLQKGEGELAYHLAMEGLELIGDSNRDDQKRQFSEMVIEAFLRMVENYEKNPIPQNAATFIHYAPKIIDATRSLPIDKILEMVELAIDELVIAYIRTKERKHIEYAQILMIAFGKNIKDNRPQLQRIFNKILNSKKKFEPEYSIHAQFRDWLRFFQALDMKSEAFHELRSLLQVLKRNASKANKVTSELLTGLYAIGIYYYIMDCEFIDECKDEIASLTQNYLETIINLSKSNSSLLEKVNELYFTIRQSPSEIRTLVFHLDSLIKDLENNIILTSQ